MAKAKSKLIMVLIESLVTKHKVVAIRERLAEKLELVRWDPYLQQNCIYKEIKKIRSV